AVTAIGAVFLGYLLPGTGAVTNLVIYPLVLGAVAILASIAGVFFVRLGPDQKIMPALYRGVFASGALALIGFLIATLLMFRDFDFALLPAATNAWSLFGASVIGIVITVLLMFITEYYTGTAYPPVQRVARASVTGAATNIIS